FCIFLFLCFELRHSASVNFCAHEGTIGLEEGNDREKLRIVSLFEVSGEKGCREIGSLVPFKVHEEEGDIGCHISYAKLFTELDPVDDLQRIRSAILPLKIDVLKTEISVAINKRPRLKPSLKKLTLIFKVVSREALKEVDKRIFHPSVKNSRFTKGREILVYSRLERRQRFSAVVDNDRSMKRGERLRKWDKMLFNMNGILLHKRKQ